MVLTLTALTSSVWGTSRCEARLVRCGASRIFQAQRLPFGCSCLTFFKPKGIQFKNVTVTSKEGPPFIVENAQIEGLKTSSD
jgi:hypothetical protein